MWIKFLLGPCLVQSPENPKQHFKVSWLPGTSTFACHDWQKPPEKSDGRGTERQAWQENESARGGSVREKEGTALPSCPASAPLVHINSILWGNLLGPILACNKGSHYPQLLGAAWIFMFHIPPSSLLGAKAESWVGALRTVSLRLWLEEECFPHAYGAMLLCTPVKAATLPAAKLQMKAGERQAGQQQPLACLKPWEKALMLARFSQPALPYFVFHRVRIKHKHQKSNM